MWSSDKIHFKYSASDNLEKLKQLTIAEARSILSSEKPYETSLLILPGYSDFFSYLDLVDTMNHHLEKTGLSSEIQIASFHPEYLFEGEPTRSRSHYTNRSPLPILHLLRESDLTTAIDRYGDTSTIPEENIRRLNKLSESDFTALFSLPKAP